MWPFKRRNKNIVPSHEISAERKEWMGLQPLTLVLRKDGSQVITARLVAKPADYVGKCIDFQGRRWWIVGVEWGKSSKMVGLIVR